MCRIVNGNLDKGLYPHNAKDHVIQALFISSHAELKRSLECEENPAFSLTMAVQNGAFFVGIWFWHLPSVGGFVLFEIWSHCSLAGLRSAGIRTCTTTVRQHS